MKNNHKIKLIAASLTLTTSFSTVAGLGGLNVQSNLGEPFSGTVTVTGEEAKVLLNGGNASLSDGSLRANVRKSGNNAVINIRSSAPVNDPVLVFQVGVGSQSRQYTAIIDPADYPADGGSAANAAPESRISGEAAEPVQQADAPQSAAAKAKLKAKKAQEQQAKKEQHKAAVTRIEKEREPVGEARKAEPASGNYKVRRGETLTSIAGRVRPSGLSVHETIAAIMTANPEIFPTRNANQILAGRVLNIPSSEELKRLAKQKSPVSVTEKQVEQTAQPVQPDTAASVDTAAPAVNAASESAATATASSLSTAAVDNTAAASEPAVADAASDVASAEVSSASATSAVQSEKPASEESSGVWRWLLFAGLGAIVLWLLFRLTGKKKAEAAASETNKNIVVRDEDNDLEDDGEPFAHSAEAGIRTHQPVAYPGNKDEKILPAATVATVAVTAATAVAAEKDESGELDVEDDFDDDIFFSETEPAQVEKTESNFNLDLGSIDRAQGGIVSGALTQDEETQKREHADWDNIESTESVYEPETESEFTHVAVEFTPTDAVEKTVSEDLRAVESVSESDTDEPLEFYTEQDSVDGSDQDAVIEFGETEPGKADAGRHDEEPEIKSVEFDGSSLIETDETGRENEEASHADISLQSDEEVLAFTSSQDDSLDNQEEISVGESIVSIEAIHDTDSSADVSFETDDAGTIEPVEAVETSVQDEGFEFQDDGDFEALNLADNAVDTETTIEWESIGVEDGSRSGDGFISESVGMTAPLEAKLELAQMYVEIGDPDAARETLQELMEESDGVILEKTKAMLNDLDK